METIQHVSEAVSEVLDISLDVYGSETPLPLAVTNCCCSCCSCCCATSAA